MDTYNFRNFSPFLVTACNRRALHVIERVLRHWEGNLINSLMIRQQRRWDPRPQALRQQHGVVRFTPFSKFQLWMNISDDCGWIILTSLSGIPTLFNYDSKAIAAIIHLFARRIGTFSFYSAYRNWFRHHFIRFESGQPLWTSAHLFDKTHYSLTWVI